MALVRNFKPDDFIKEMNKLGAGVKKYSKEIQGAVAADVFERTVTKTPVRTGHARQGWDLTIGAPSTKELDKELLRGFKGRKKGRLSARRYGPPMTSGEVKTVRKLKGAVGVAQTAQDIYITNNVEYINALEGGQSDQAPSGMLILALQATQATFGEIAKKELRRIGIKV